VEKLWSQWLRAPRELTVARRPNRNRRAVWVPALF